MTDAPLSPIDREHLAELSVPANELLANPELDHLLTDCSETTRQTIGEFLGHALDWPEDPTVAATLLNEARWAGEWPSQRLLLLFDAWLDGLGRHCSSRWPEGGQQSRQALDAARRMAFFLLGRLLAHDTPPFDETTDIEAALQDLLAAPPDTNETLAVLAIHSHYPGLGSNRIDTRAIRHADDEILARFETILRPDDRLFRIAPQQALVLLPHVSGAAHAQLAIHRIQEAGSQPIALGFGPQPVNTCVGGALAGRLQNAGQLLQAAWRALQEAEISVTSWHLYSPGDRIDDTPSQAQVAALTEALEKNALMIHFQPQVAVGDGELHGFEALLRWTHNGKPVSPPEVLAIALQGGLSRNLTQWIINAAMRLFADFARNHPDWTLSINLQPGDFGDPGLSDALELAATTWLLDPGQIVLEITESSVLHDIDKTIQLLERMKGNGFRIALDDFGTGYSSLTHIRRLPLDIIKIDKSFVLGMCNNAEDARIVETTIELAHHFDAEVVAEGVETVETAKRLIEMGCDVLQGYLFSPALAPDDLRTWLAAHTAEPSPQ